MQHGRKMQFHTSVLTVVPEQHKGTSTLHTLFFATVCVKFHAYIEIPKNKILYWRSDYSHTILSKCGDCKKLALSGKSETIPQFK